MDKKRIGKKMSDEERRKRKRDCEKRRREKIKNDPERSRLEKLKKHDLYEKAKEKGMVKLKKEMSRRELKSKRKSWKEHSKRYREKKKLIEKLNRDTPPLSEDDAYEENLQNENTTQNKHSSSGTDTPSTSTPKISNSRQKVQGKKLRDRNRVKLYKQIERLQNETKILRKNLERYKKKYYRKIKKDKDPFSPNTKVNKLLENSPKLPIDIKKKLLFGEALSTDLSHKFKELKDEQSKQIFCKIVDGPHLKKYRLYNEAKNFLTPGRHRSISKKTNSLQYDRKKIRFNNIKKLVEEFYLTDKSSRVCPGKRDTITKKGIKKQRRYLNNTMKNLCSEFRKENPSTQISYAAFCRLRPFWVVAAKLSNRDTCLCVLHDNVDLLISSLHRNHILRERNAYQIMSNLCCSKKTEECLERRCQNCNHKKIMYHVKEEQWNENIFYKKWTTKTEQRVNNITKKNNKCKNNM